MIFPGLFMDFLVFCLASGSTFCLLAWGEARYRRRLLQRRMEIMKPSQPGSRANQAPFPLNRVVLTLGQVAVPKKGKEISRIKTLLSHAGYRDEADLTVFYGLKLGGGLVLTAMFLLFQLALGLVSSRTPLLIFLPFGAGYFLPDMVLRQRAKSRIDAIFRELPDTLDLLVICLYAGLGFDYALYRVCRELKDIAPVMSEEFGRYFLETRGGLVRDIALNNLAGRNGSEPLKSVVNVLLQSSRIGTDMARALKVYTDTMRKERQQMAEEQGAKLGTKLTLPLVVFILPALMLIILGPVIINFVKLVTEGF